MLYYIDSAGVVQAAIPDTVTQGAINVNDIVIIAPFPISTVVTAAITLPNGMKIYPRYVGYEEIQESDYAYKFAPVTAFEGKIPAPDGVTVNVWKMTLDRALAQKAGALRLTFLFTDAYGHTLPSTEVTLNVGRASPYLSPTVTANDLNTIQAYLAAAQAAVLSAEAVAASVAKTWDLVIGPDNADLLGTLSESAARSILVSGVDLDYVALPTNNSFKTIQAGAGLRELEFRGCRYSSEGAEIIIMGNAVAKIHGVDFPAVYEIYNFASVENCNAGIFNACEFMSGCFGNVARGCKTITGSDIATIYDCTYVDPFSVKTNTSSVNKVAVVTADGTPRFAECAKAIDVSVNQETYVLTITLKGLTDGVMSTATVDLPIEQIVVSGTVSADGDELILTLKNGETITIPVSGIVLGLVEQTSAANQIYGTDASGNQTTMPYNKAASPNNVVQRTSTGNINLPETQENSSQAVRKSYVDKIGERAYYDHVITDEETLLSLNQFTGRILVKDVVLTQIAFANGTILEANANATLIEFSNLTLGGFLTNAVFTVNGHSKCTLKNFSLKYASAHFITIDSFGIVEHCDTSGYDSGSIVNCGAVRDCRTSYIRNCEFVSDCHMYADNDAYLTNCKYVCGIYQEEGNLGGGITVTCNSCQFVSNVNAEGVYRDCTYVDPNTCKGFIKDEDEGKVQVLTKDGTFQTAAFPNTGNFVQKNEFDNVVTQVGAIVDNHENRIATLEDGSSSGGGSGGKLYEHRVTFNRSTYDSATGNTNEGFTGHVLIYNRSADHISSLSDIMNYKDFIHYSFVSLGDYPQDIIPYSTNITESRISIICYRPSTNSFSVGVYGDEDNVTFRDVVTEV
ncbi:MAG: hypothetical protein IKL79_01310 [Clostridia bacterium]|nr:hypothetical protein [Clostridia bacterium]